MSRIRRLLLLPLLVGALAPWPAYAGDAGRAGSTVDTASSTSAQRAVDSVHLTGRGYGHGKGLSQYGALGRARNGDGYRSIIRFYYPHSRWGRSGGKVRVLLTGDTDNKVVVLDRPGLKVTALRSGRTWRPGRSAKRWRITPAGHGGKSAISYKTGRWHRWRTVRGEAQFTAKGGPLRLVTPSGKVDYRGALRSARPDGARKHRDTVNVLSLESYLRGVVPREVPALWPTHAVRAQAVAARTYAAFERAASPSGRHYQLCDTAHCQVYGGASAEHPGATAAVKATAHEVRTRGGDPIFAQFSASNGGWSVQGAFDYLPAQEDAVDRATYPEWERTIPAGDVTRHWEGLGDLESVTVTERDGNGSYGGRALTVRVQGTKSSVTVDGSTFASFLGLRSTLFRVD